MKGRVLLLALTATRAYAQAPTPDTTHKWVPSDSYLGNEGLELEAEYEGGPVPDGARIEVRRHETLFKIGLITAAGLWGANILAGASAHLYCNGGCVNNDWALLYLPLLGPAILASLPSVQSIVPTSKAVAITTVLVIDSVIQISGLGLALMGWLWPQRFLVIRTPKHVRLELGAPSAAAGVSFRLAF